MLNLNTLSPNKYYSVHINTLICEAKRVSYWLIESTSGHTPDPPRKKNSSVLHKSHGSAWPRLGGQLPPPAPRGYVNGFTSVDAQLIWGSPQLMNASVDDILSCSSPLLQLTSVDAYLSWCSPQLLLTSVDAYLSWCSLQLMLTSVDVHLSWCSPQLLLTSVNPRLSLYSHFVAAHLTHLSCSSVLTLVFLVF